MRIGFTGLPASVWALIATAITVFGVSISPAQFIFAQEQEEAPKQENKSNSDSSTDPTVLKNLIERIQKQEARRDPQQRPVPIANPTPEQQVMTLLDSVNMEMSFYGTPQPRFLVFRVLLANPTHQSFSIPLDHVIAEIDGEEKLPQDPPDRLQNYQITTSETGRQPTPLSAMKLPKGGEWLLPAEGTSGLWLVYSQLPLGANVPKCRLKIKIGDTTKVIDVNEVQRANLALQVERVGPRNCLALITIGGALTSFNSGAFVDELDKLVEQKVARVVIRWATGAAPVDQRLMNWLLVAAAGNGGNPNQNPMYPVIPASIREFHLVEYSGRDDSQGRQGGPYGLRPTAAARIHKTTPEAVSAALRTAYLALPLDELVKEIRTGHPLTRAAALAFGGGRLSIDQLPLIFTWAEESEPEIQKAALQALSHFGEPAAIDKLVAYARQNVEPRSTSAIESLAGSRFGAAHQALLTLLKNEPAESKKKIVSVLAKYPRPIWSDTLYEFVTDPSNEAIAESLRALVQVGHPHLVDVLERSLTSADKSIRELAYQELSKRNDERSEALAVNYALTLLESGPPDNTTLQLLSRVKDSRAIPLLLNQLDVSNDRSNAISLLLQLGDQAVADTLVQKYPFLNTNEKVQVIQGLRMFRHGRFRELCGQALMSNDNQLVTTAANALKQDGHPESESLLIAALDQQKASHLLPNIMNAISEFGTPTARTALIKVRDSDDKNKKAYAMVALTNLSRRSPGFQYVYQAESLRQQPNKEKEAVKAFDMALQLDPSLPEAYLGRAHVELKLERFGPAKRDFEKVLDLKYEPLDGEFVTGLAIARIGDGQLADGIKYLEDNRPKMFEEFKQRQKPKEKAYFHYNSACAYARALEQVDKQPDLEGRMELRDKYRSQAFMELAESFEQGFDEYDWTAKDPDLKILHGDAEFKKILDGQHQPKPEEKKPATPPQAETGKPPKVRAAK